MGWGMWPTVTIFADQEIVIVCSHRAPKSLPVIGNLNFCLIILVSAMLIIMIMIVYRGDCWILFEITRITLFAETVWIWIIDDLDGNNIIWR